MDLIRAGRGTFNKRIRRSSFAIRNRYKRSNASAQIEWSAGDRRIGDRDMSGPIIVLLADARMHIASETDSMVERWWIAPDANESGIGWSNKLFGTSTGALVT